MICSVCTDTQRFQKLSGSERVYLVVLAPVDVRTACEACCIQDVGRLDLHGQQRSRKVCDCCTLEALVREVATSEPGLCVPSQYQPARRLYLPA